MNACILVILAVLAVFGKIEARPQDETAPASEQIKKADEVEENKEYLSKNPTAAALTETVEEKSGDKNGEPDPADPKPKRSTDEAPAEEITESSSTEVVTSAAPANESKSGHDEIDLKSGESTEAPKIEQRKASEEKSASKVDDNKSGDNVSERSGVYERTSAVESRENKNPPKDELRSSTAEVSTSTDVVQQKSAYGSHSILDYKGRSGGSGESDSSEAFRGRAHVNLRVLPVNPMAAVNKINDIGSRRMDQPNLMLNFPQKFHPPIHQTIPTIPPPPFNSYLNAAPSPPNAKPANAPNFSQHPRSFNDVFRPETNAYPYSPASSQQVDSLSKFPTIRGPSKLPAYPHSVYRPYDQNYSGHFGARPRRYTVPSSPDTMHIPNKYVYTGFGYPQYI